MVQDEQTTDQSLVCLTPEQPSTLTSEYVGK